ncbi:DNA helicase, partial [Actinotignum timonense]|nr:DNA helicase [Actinotignum timonense]
RAAPAGRVRRADRLQVVDGRGVPSPNTGMVEAPSAEVDAVVDAVVDHLLTRPEESLAVITISRLHAVHVRAAVERTIANSPALAEAGESAASLVPVVDITGASGLRRDRVIFSVGFGKTVHGRVLHTFGPLTEAEGARYLSEALLVPSRYMSVISSLGPGDPRKDHR